jgi:hypothetical protein
MAQGKYVFADVVKGKLRTTILKRDGHKCTRCGVTEELHIHHIRPRSWMGQNEPRNLLTLCKSCHKEAHEGVRHLHKRAWFEMRHRVEAARYKLMKVDCERLAQELGVETLAAQVLLILAISEYDGLMPTECVDIAELWWLRRADVKRAVPACLKAGYIRQLEDTCLRIEFSRFDEFPLWRECVSVICGQLWRPRKRISGELQPRPEGDDGVVRRVLCCGDKAWAYHFLDADYAVRDTERNDREWDIIHRELSAFPPGATVIHGDGNGAERACGMAARKAGFAVEKFPPDWERYGRQAGPINNCKMLRDGEPDIVLVFTSDIEQNKGASHMVKIASAANIPVRIITS